MANVASEPSGGIEPRSRPHTFGVRPFVVADKWHYFVYPWVFYGQFPITQFWENGPEDPNLLASFTPQQIDTILYYWRFGWDAFTAINRAFYSAKTIPITRAAHWKLTVARTDLYTVVAILKYMDELWNAMYLGHLSAEKALKALLVGKGMSPQEVRAHGHDLARLIDSAARFEPRFARRVEILASMRWNDDWRYEPRQFSKAHVLAMFDGALALLADVVDALVPDRNRPHWDEGENPMGRIETSFIPGNS